MAKLISILINRSDVESQNIQPILLQLNHFASSAELAKSSFESVDVVFGGYDDDPRELWEIEEVRAFVSSLNNAFTHWVYILNKETSGLQAILFCLLPVQKSEHGSGQLSNSRAFIFGAVSLNSSWWSKPARTMDKGCVLVLSDLFVRLPFCPSVPR